MQLEEIRNKIEEMVGDGQDYDTIKKHLETAYRPAAEDRKLLLSYTDEMIYHRALQAEDRSKALTQLLMGIALLLVPLLVAYVAYEPGSKIKLIWYGASLIGGWNIKEGWKKYRAPFEPPSRFGYKRKKFQRF
jgi:hypothetical protein